MDDRDGVDGGRVLSHCDGLNEVGNCVLDGDTLRCLLDPVNRSLQLPTSVAPLAHFHLPE